MPGEIDNSIVTNRNGKSLEFRRLLAEKHDFFEQVENYCLLGATEAELVEFFGVERGDWLYYVKHSQELRDAITRGGKMADARVSRAMFKRATGYEYARQRIIVGKDGKGVVHDLVEHVPPDTSAGKFWLTNRSPKKWSDRHDPSHGGGDGPVDTNITINFVGAAPRDQPLLNVSPANEEPIDARMD